MDVGSKENFCRGLGADHFIDFEKSGTDEEMSEVNRLVPGGVKVVLCCAGSKRAYSQAVTFLGVRGTLVCLGVPERQVGERMSLFDLEPVLLDELNIIGK